MTDRTRPLDPLVDRVRAEQCEGWHGGERVLAEAYLAKEPTLADDGEALLDLIYSEVLLREEHGERTTADEYAARFPRLSDAIRRQFAVHTALTAADEPERETLDGALTIGVGEGRAGSAAPADIRG